MSNSQLDQVYSASNFRDIWYQQTRRGVSIPTKLIRNQKIPDPLLLEINENFRRTKKARKQLRRLRSAKAPLLDIRRAQKKVKRRLKKREELVEAYVRSIETSARHGTFDLTIRTARHASGKQLYDLAEPYAENYFVGKLLQTALAASIPSEIWSRDSIIERLLTVLEDRMPKSVVRIDISSFFESIPHDKLRIAVNRNTKLGSNFKKRILSLLTQYATLTGQHPDSAIGVPRGVGVSSYLAELYLAEFDRQTSETPGMVFYARYVDDIVVVFAESRGNLKRASERLAELESRLGALGLSLSAAPGKKFHGYFSSVPRGSNGFDYLGYTFTYSSSRLVVTMTPERVLMLERRLERVFNAFAKSKSKEGRAMRLLLQRVRLLSGNTRLHNNKRDAFVGVYYSNKFMTDYHQLRELDGKLATYISSLGPTTITRKLAANSFETGFADKVFWPFPATTLREIVSVWRYLG